MGAVSGSRLLSAPDPGGGPGAFDVEPFRTAGRRVVLREVRKPLVVLGSTQREDVVDAERARRTGAGVVRRRSGGGAVLLQPGAQIWADLWIPRADPLWSADPHGSAAVAGAWWARALGAPGRGGLEIHRGQSPGPGRGVVCFADLGPGEVSRGGRKLVGLAQWRSREGALVHGCAYRRWDPGPLVHLLALSPGARRALAASLAHAAVGVDEVVDGEPWGAEDLLGALPGTRPWEVVRA